ncbi:MULTISPECIES: hypothetical protein [Nocardia]|uniref:hypothetical protein n=1 Tax=Nocardia TaxID=1817 RepID=UPI000D69C637|nr:MULTISPECIES: hypothetical protein [Nocardia]
MPSTTIPTTHSQDFSAVPGYRDDEPHPVYAALAGAVVVPIADELAAWAHPMREFGHDLRLVAAPSPATDAVRTDPHAVAARRARRTPRATPVALRHRVRDARAAAARCRAEAELDDYFADREPLAA